MSLVGAWILFPALLVALSQGCGLLIERLSGLRLPGALLAATGFALIVVAGQFLTLADATAELTAPLVVTLAVAGIGLSGREALDRVDRWAVALATGCFAAFAAPIVLSGEATFAGYIKLDDTATWMALTDRVMEAGRSLDGLAPSTYEATLAFNLGDGYPVGVFLPLGVATLLSGEDVAWTIQPYMAVLGALLGLALWQLAGRLVEARALRALVAFAGSQSALLYGYYLWGGVKEVAAAALLASAAALAMFAVSRRGEPCAVIALALVCAAVIGVLSPGGALWLAAPLVGALALLIATAGRRASVRAAAWCGAFVVALSLPVLFTGLLPPTSSPLTSSDAQGNLIGSLEPSQVAGVWPAGDFRLDPAELATTYVLIAIVVAAAVVALVLAWRRRDWGLLLYVNGTLFACLAIFLLGSPWVDGKALATASPAIPFAAALGSAVLWARGLRVEGGVLLVLVVGGVLWSNALQYREVNLAPREQLAELEQIGDLIAGEGPTLMTEYQPYGARHFLRDADPEAASELRRRRVRLVDGGTLAKGEYADTDRFDLGELLVYRTLVLRRGPDQSRPPSAYELDWRGDFYEVWQRPDPPPERIAHHLGLGGEVSPVGAPDCGEVRRLAERAGSDGTVRAAPRAPVAVASLDRAEYPEAWTEIGAETEPVPSEPGDLALSVAVPEAGSYEVWLRGSVRPETELLIDGRSAGTVRHQLNNAGLYVRLGEGRLERGQHEITVRFRAADLHPGSAGSARSIGPLVLSTSDATKARLVEVASEDAEARLCGRSWDWIEAVAG